MTGTKRDIVQSARSQFLSVGTNIARVKARNRAIISAESALAPTETDYSVSIRNIVELLQAQKTVFQARGDYANARFDYIKSTLALKKSGWSIEPR